MTHVSVLWTKSWKCWLYILKRVETQLITGNLFFEIVGSNIVNFFQRFCTVSGALPTLAWHFTGGCLVKLFARCTILFVELLQLLRLVLQRRCWVYRVILQKCRTAKTREKWLTMIKIDLFGPEIVYNYMFWPENDSESRFFDQNIT